MTAVAGLEIFTARPDGRSAGQCRQAAFPWAPVLPIHRTPMRSALLSLEYHANTNRGSARSLLALPGDMAVAGELKSASRCYLNHYGVYG